VHSIDQSRERRDPIGRHAAIVQIGQVLLGSLEPPPHLIESLKARGWIDRPRWMRIVGAKGGGKTRFVV